MNLARLAADLRARAGLVMPSFSTRAIVGACFPWVTVTGRTLPAGVHEVVTIGDDGPLIVYQRQLSTPEQRFAIAHAVGHLVLDFGPAGPLRPLQDPIVEARADAFAAELLVPLAELSGHVARHPAYIETPLDRELYLDHVDHLASRFKVPTKVVDQQIRRLHA